MRFILSSALTKQDGETRKGGGVGAEHFGRRESGGGIMVGVRGKQQWTEICTQSVLPDTMVVVGGGQEEDMTS